MHLHQNLHTCDKGKIVGSQFLVRFVIRSGRFSRHSVAVSTANCHTFVKIDRGMLTIARAVRPDDRLVRRPTAAFETTKGEARPVSSWP